MLSTYFLDSQVGVFVLQTPKLSFYQSLLLIIGTVVLAPICEEIFFRGFMLKAYDGRFKKYGFVIVGVIFGFYHILNGITNVIPASILGISMGYLVYKTGAISTSMIFHAMNNLSAVIFSGMLGTAVGTTLPLWFLILSIIGLCISLILLSCIKATPKSDDIIEDTVGEKKVSRLALVFIIISGMYLTSIGVIEILSRLEIL
jgi:membrane protease YdiL (CAAX protease family)